MSTLTSLMAQIKTLAVGFQHNFGAGTVPVFRTVKIYDKENFNRAAEDLLLIEKPALVLVYGGSSYKREGAASVAGSTRKANDRRTPQFLFFIADQAYGFETQEAAALGDSNTRGAITILDLWRDRLALINPKADWNLNVSPFEPVRDEVFPIDPEVGDAVVYSLTMQCGFYETAGA